MNKKESLEALKVESLVDMVHERNDTRVTLFNGQEIRIILLDEVIVQNYIDEDLRFQSPADFIEWVEQIIGQVEHYESVGKFDLMTEVNEEPVEFDGDYLIRMEWIVKDFEYDDPEIFQGCYSPVPREELASIEQLRATISREDDEVFAWGDNGVVLAVAEGYFIWDDEKGDYDVVEVEYMREKRMATFHECVQMKVPNCDDDIHIHDGEMFPILHEYVDYIGGVNKPVTYSVIHKEGTTPIVVNELMPIHTQVYHFAQFNFLEG